MADEQGSGVDPRFNPAFQRGFVGDVFREEDLPEAARGVGSASASGSPLAGSGADGSAVAVAPADSAPATTAPTDAEPTVHIDAGGADAGSQESGAPAARNPYLIALLIVALLLIAAGIWLFVSTENQFDSSEVQSQGDYISLTALIEFAPFLGLLGGAIIVGVVFVFALRYRRRP